MSSPLLARVARPLMLLCVLAAGFGPSPSQSPASPAAAGDQVGRVEPMDRVAAREVRLRKLHLVRPDLIPYPIAYEVCC